MSICPVCDREHEPGDGGWYGNHMEMLRDMEGDIDEADHDEDDIEEEDHDEGEQSGHA